MKIAIETSALTTGHKFRGTGSYLDNLKKALIKYYPDNQYLFFDKRESIPLDVDLLHYPYFDPFFLNLPLFKRHKTVVTVHDLTPIVFAKDFPPGIKGAVKWQIQKHLLAGMDAVITDSESSKNDIHKYARVQENKIEVIYLAADPDFKPVKDKLLLDNIKKKYLLPDDFVLYVGDVTVNKNLPRLTKAVRKLDLPLVLVGKALKNDQFDRGHPWNKDLVRVLNIIGDDKKIFRLGFVPISDLAVIYSLAKVFVMPSLYEGFGLPVLEAMACGCPVVTSDKGSLKEVAGEAACYADPYSIDDISSKIKQVFFDSKLREKFSVLGEKRADDFSWKQTAGRTVSVYKRVCGFSVKSKT